MKQYNIVTAVSQIDLIAYVNHYLSMDWQCQGGLCIDNNGWFYQALVKP